MMGIDKEKQNQFVFLNLDELVPSDHLLRMVRENIDFTFIYEKVSSLYSTLGRRSIDPVLFIKMLLLGYLYGVSSERKLEQEVKLNLAYRWFLGLDPMEPVPDHSTLSQNRRRRFKDTAVFQEIFDHIVSLCVAKGLVTGNVIVVDSTHIKASASPGRFERVVVEKKPSEYLAELEKEARRLEESSDHEPKKNKRGKKPQEENPQKEISQSITDPDSGLLGRPNKPKGFHYLAHTSIDTKHGIITDIHVTAGNINDHEPFVGRLSVQQEKYRMEIRKVGADKGYDHSGVHHGLEKLNIEGYISPKVDAPSQQPLSLIGFTYESERDIYLCPERKMLRFTHVKYNSRRQSYAKRYAAKATDCRACPGRHQCFGEATSFRTIDRVLFQEARERNQERTQTEDYRSIQKLRRIWCEGTFGTMKKQHNLRETYKRGIWNISEHCLLSALAMNIKRIIKATV